MKNWLLYEREKESSASSSEVERYKEEGIHPFSNQEFQPGPWERQSQELSVSEEYKKLFDQFIPYFEKEMGIIGDASMEKERDLLKKLASPSN